MKRRAYWVRDMPFALFTTSSWPWSFNIPLPMTPPWLLPLSMKNLPWKGTRPAKQFAPNCMQLDPPAWGTMRKNVSEDCLYLNVYLPPGVDGADKDVTLAEGRPTILDAAAAGAASMGQAARTANG